MLPYEAFAQDDWKVTKRLTVNFGLRISHFQPWIDRLGYGYSTFNYADYNSSCTPTQYCGFQWHKRDPSVPIGGFPTRFAFYQPRFGLAYDLFGAGKTVLRGGWGRYYYHAGQFTNGLDVAAGVQTTTVSPSTVGGVPLFANQLDTLNFTSQALSPAAVDSQDSKQPYTDSYSFTISQRLPWSSLMEVAYVGNQTHDIPGAGNGGSLGINTLNLNLVPMGAMLSSNNGGADPNKLNANTFRPLQGFSDLYVATNNGWSNYNSMQVTWVRTKGRYTVNMNYTYSKALGIVGFYDQFNLNNDYGVLPSNRTHIFNAAYSIDLGDHTKARLAGAFVNGWQLSGITQIESGANLTGFSGQNFGMNLNGATVPGTNFLISNTALLGTPNMQLNPILTCNPTANLGPHQFINSSCFSMPTQIGQNGPTTLPAMYGPAFFNSDLALFKNFNFTESKKLQFRIDGYNFLNHPLWSFTGSNLSLGFDPGTGKVNNPNFGTTTFKQGFRVIQLAIKFYF